MTEDPTPMTDLGPVTVNTRKLDEFVSLLGRDPAQHWLDRFRKELLHEFSEPMPKETSRTKMYHFCARAGLLGFDALHKACHDFLETRSGQDAVAIYQGLRSHADHASQEIERRCARLA